MSWTAAGSSRAVSAGRGLERRVRALVMAASRFQRVHATCTADHAFAAAIIDGLQTALQVVQSDWRRG